MNKRQEMQLAMARAVRAVCDGASTITASIAAFPGAYARFGAKLDEVETQAQLQLSRLRAVIEDRDQKQTAMVDAALALAGMALTYAHQNDLRPLGVEMEVTGGDFNRARPTLKVRMAQQVCDTVRPLVTALAAHGVTAAMVDDLQEKIDAANAALATPRQSTAERRAATAEIAAKLKELTAILQNQLDPLLHPLRKTNRSFYAQYQAARQIVNLPGTRTPEATALATPATTPAAQPAAAPASAEKRAA
ncbi:MAG TPA: hypothetical protein VHD62_16750 [Opitutaceae bacterium]|nr:hypothetical protein [Opitutaceae bacterium]